MQRTYKYPLNLDGMFNRLTGLFIAASTGYYKQLFCILDVYYFFFTVVYAIVIFNRYQECASLLTASELYSSKFLSTINFNKSSPNAIKLSIIFEVSTQRFYFGFKSINEY